MAETIHVALVGGQWIEVNVEDAIYYLHTKRLGRPNSDDLSQQTCVDRFREHCRRSQNRGGSPLKREYDPQANMTWRCVEIDGRSQWVEADWSLEPPRKLWGFDNDSNDEYSYEDESERAAERVTSKVVVHEHLFIPAMEEHASVDKDNGTQVKW